MDLPKAAVAEAWDSQAFAAAARPDPVGNPDLASSFTPAELSAVGDAILRSVTRDGSSTAGEQPAGLPFSIPPLGPSGSGAPRARSALEKVFGGAKNLKGKSLTRWFWDRGGVARLARLEDRAAVSAPGNTSLNTTLGGGAPVHSPRHRTRRPGAGLEAEHGHHDRPQPAAGRTMPLSPGCSASTWISTRRRSLRRPEVQGVGDEFGEAHRLPTSAR